MPPLSMLWPVTFMSKGTHTHTISRTTHKSLQKIKYTTHANTHVTLLCVWIFKRKDNVLLLVLTAFLILSVFHNIFYFQHFISFTYIIFITITMPHIEISEYLILYTLFNFIAIYIYVLSFIPWHIYVIFVIFHMLLPQSITLK